MFRFVLEAVKKLSKDELCLLMAAILNWYNDCDYQVGTVKQFKKWLATQQLAAEKELEAARLLAEAEERELAARMLPPADAAAWG